MKLNRNVLNLALAGVLIMAFSGCMRDMQDQARYEPLEASEFFKDGMASRQPVEGTVARGQLRLDKHLYEGTVDGVSAKTFPMTVNRRLMERFDIYCSVCHGKTGAGDGLVVQRGFPAPKTYHSDRLRDADPGYFFNIITQGFGKMSSYAKEVTAEDRWAIVAYIRALQQSQNTDVDEIPRDFRKYLDQPQESSVVENKGSHH